MNYRTYKQNGDPMRIKCDYCESYLSDTDERCPSCGAANAHLKRTADGIPTTIEQLLEFCKQRNLPLRDMRFFIGENYKEPRAFGIYKDDNGKFIVYKNKGDGTRAIRYEGYDEAYAVNEIYQKMKSEIALRKQPRRGVPSPVDQKKQKRRNLTFIAIFAALFVSCVACVSKMPDTGYYVYNGNSYYNYRDDWYIYDYYSNNWSPTIIESGDELYDNYSNYWQGSDYDSDFGGYDFKDSGYYDSSSSYDSGSSWDDDDDWSWGSDSWDSGSTDWGSDW